jgi:SnoaL-like domain
MEMWEVIARESIRDRIARWNANGDAGRYADMVQVLAPDVEFEATGSPALRGRDAVLEFLGGVGHRKQTELSGTGGAAAGRYLPPGGRPSIRHYTSTINIDLESETHARVRSYYVVLSASGLDHWGRYLDEFGVVDGEWLITHRTITTEGVDPDGWAAQLR